MEREFNFFQQTTRTRFDFIVTVSPKIEDAVRLILTPNAGNDTGESEFLSTYPSSSATLASTGTPIATYTVNSSDLDRMAAFLLRGERRKAVRYALDHKLWAQALVISSCVDTNCWQEVVNAFLRCELGRGVEGAANGSNGREGLRVAYAMFAGLNARETGKSVFLSILDSLS